MGKFLIFAPSIVAGLIVAFYACGRYGTPSTNKASTTKARFYVTGGAYALCAVTLYAILTQLVVMPGFAKYLALDGADITGLDASIPAPFLSALLLTSLLPNVPLLSQIDKTLLRFFQKLGSIPSEVRRLGSELTKADYQVPADMGHRIRKMMDDAHLKVISEDLCEELRFNSADTARSRLSKNLALYTQIEELRSDRRFANFFEEYKEADADLQKKVGLFAGQAAALFAFSALIPMDAHLKHEALKKARLEFKENCAVLYEDLCNFLARALLHVSWSQNALNELIADFGFTSVASPPGILANAIVLAGLYAFSLFGSAFWFFSFFSVGAAPLSLPRWVTIALVVATNHCVGAACALAPKLLWPTSDRIKTRSRPVLIYLLSALVTGAIAALVIITYHSLWAGDIQAGLEKYRLLYPWTFSPMISCFALAVLCDGNIESDVDNKWRRWIEGAVLAATMAVGGAIIWSWINNIASEAAAHSPRVFPVILAAGLGAVFGSIVPHSYREFVRDRRAARRQRGVVRSAEPLPSIGLQGEGV